MPRFSFRFLLSLAVFLLSAAVRAGAAPSVDYTVSFDLPAETFRVKAVLQEIGGESLVFHFPIWGPGAYDIVNFGQYVNGFTARQEGRSVQVVRIDKNSFRITGMGGGAPLQIDYAVHDIERVENSLWFGLTDIEPNFAFANTVAIFGYAEGYKDVPCTVNFEMPKDWDLSVGLDPVEGTPARGVASYRARDYDELVDMPIQMGKFQKVEFIYGGKPHLITVTSPRVLSSAELNGLRDTTKLIVGWISSIFGGDVPYDRYIFQHYLVDMNGNTDYSFGALEHRNSSTYRMPLDNRATPARVLAGVIAHEYWHLWSPKRIHVTELGPFDYQRAPHTNSLWFAEGLTEYYAQVVLARNGITEEGMLGKLNGGVFKTSYRKKQPESMASLSLRVAEAPLSEVISVYSKGPVVTMLLDIAIRVQTDNRITMDSVMRFFNREYGQTGRTFGDDEIITIMERASGTQLQDFYRKYITGTEPLPYDELLPKAGLKVVEGSEKKRVLGADAVREGDGLKLTSITPKQSAEAMGLRVGDMVTALQINDSVMAIPGLWEKMVESGLTLSELVTYLPSRTTFILRRDGAEQKIPLKLIQASVPVHRVEPDPNASGTALAIRRDIIGQ